MPDAELRKPRASYRDTNGFEDPVRLRITGHTHVPNLHAVPPATNATAVSAHAKGLRDAVERRNFVEDVLSLKGSYFPGVSMAKEIDEQRETSASLEERIAKLRQQHWNEMQTLYDWQADEYLEDAKEMYLFKDDSINDPQIGSMYRAYRSADSHLVQTFEEAASAHRYAHLSTLAGLLRKHGQLAKDEAAVRRRQDANFPASITDYKNIRSKDVQVRIGRFLIGDTNARDKMMTEYHWVWRQVQPLVDAYDQDDDFKNEMQDLVRGSEARDPRRKAS